MSHTTMNLNLKVWRQKNSKTAGAFQMYRVENISDEMSFLEMMDILNEDSHSIYSDALDTLIKNGDILKLKDGTQVRVGAIPAKENPKYKTGMVLAADLSRDARGPMTIDINNDVEEVL